jgi:hypothetical protein
MKSEFTTEVYEDENCIVRIHRPILSEKEKVAQEEKLKSALVRYYRKTRIK